MNIKDLFGTFAPQSTVQPDPLFNRREAGWNAAGGALQGLGIGLMTGDWAKAMDVNNSAVDQYRQRKMQKYTAQQLMEEAAAKKAEREQAQAEIQRKNEWLKGISDPKMRATLEANPNLIDDYVKATDSAFQVADTGQSANWGMSVVPLRNRQTGELVAGQFNQGQGGIFVNGSPADPSEWEYDPGALAQDKAAGTLVGGAPGKVVDQYTTKTRAEMSALSDTVLSVREARKFLSKGIQTGSMSDTLQGLRSLGAQLGFNVDESVLANTQTYQNFIGNVVIPRMAALGGNDSNEELKKLFSLSGGDINQSLAALNNTLDYMDKLFARKYKSLKSVEDVALKYLPGLEPVPFGYGDASAAGGGEAPDLSTMSDQELEALASGQ